jgi:hypothetical protein
MFLVLLYPNFIIPFRLIDLSVWSLVQAVWPCLKYALIMGVGVLLVRMGGAWLDAPTVLVLIVSVATGVLTYTALMVWSKPAVVYDMMGLISLQRVPVLQRAALRFGLIK